MFAKLREDRPRPVPSAPAIPAEEPRPGNASTWGIWAGVIAMALCALGVGWVQARKPPAPAVTSTTSPAPPPDAALPAPDVRGGGPVGPMDAPTVPPQAPLLPPAPLALNAADDALAKSLATLIDLRKISEADVAAATALQSRHPDNTYLQKLLMEVLLTRGYTQATQQRYAEAVATLRRAAALPWAEHRVRITLVNTLLSASDWAGAEAYARQLVSADPRDADAWYALGYALFRLDRNREAAEALKMCTQIRADERAQSLLARLEKHAYDEDGMKAQNVSHFHVRYDGEEHAEVGREIVQALERHYATLVSSLDHQPQSAIPVVLFTQEKYRDAAGAPAWAGGSFHQDDGRIRLPIGGLTRSLTPGIDSTLLHELTHAFIYDKTRGVAPRDIHEGFAQYMEGERASSTQLGQLASGEVGGVEGFYLGALSFVEYLIALRGHGGMNDLLKAMGDTGNVNEAFRQVHGRDYGSVQKAWLSRLRQQHGG